MGIIVVDDRCNDGFTVEALYEPASGRTFVHVVDDMTGEDQTFEVRPDDLRAAYERPFKENWAARVESPAHA